MANPNDGLIAAYADTLPNTGPATFTGALTVTGLITASGGISTQAVSGGYLGQSFAPEVNSATAVALTTAYGYLTRVVVPIGGLSTYLDVIVTSATFTNAIWGLYTGTGTNPIAYTAESHTTLSAAGLYSIPWVSTVTLTPGTYYVYQELTGTSPTMPGVTATSTGSIGATIMNPNCALASGTLNSALLASGAPSTIGASTSLTFGTGWALASTKVWYGIR
jgi:hypothetical protein